VVGRRCWPFRFVYPSGHLLLDIASARVMKKVFK
jgi:hypothetical protein